MTFSRKIGFFCLSLSMMTAISLGQNRPQAGGAAGAMAGGGGPIPAMLQAIKELNLPADEQTSIQGVIRQAAEDARDAGAGMQDATQQERLQKMQDMRKIYSDAKDKAEGMLTADQKTKYYPLYAKALLSQAVDRVKLFQTASAKLQINDDERTQLKTLFDGDLKTLDGFKTDADAVTDQQGATDLQEKTTKLAQDTRMKLVDILGQQDVQQLMQNMRPAGARNAQGGANGATSQAAPTTKPA